MGSEDGGVAAHEGKGEVAFVGGVETGDDDWGFEAEEVGGWWRGGGGDPGGCLGEDRVLDFS